MQTLIGIKINTVSRDANFLYFYLNNLCCKSHTVGHIPESSHKYIFVHTFCCLDPPLFPNLLFSENKTTKTIQNIKTKRMESPQSCKHKFSSLCHAGHPSPCSHPSLHSIAIWSLLQLWLLIRGLPSCTLFLG